MLPWSPLAGGLLGGVLEKTASGRRASDFIRGRIEQHRAQLEAYEGLCADLEIPPGEVALAWVLRHPAVTAPIVGPRTMEHLESAIRALDVTLDDETASRLDEIFPGPGGPAPESYAW